MSTPNRLGMGAPSTRGEFKRTAAGKELAGAFRRIENIAILGDDNWRLVGGRRLRAQLRAALADIRRVMIAIEPQS